MAPHSSITNPIWWTNSLGSMYQRGEHTDVNLVVEGKNIAVHRSVLAALSPLFHQLLENKIELQDTTIILDDFRYQPIAMLMNFVYNGTVEGSTADLVDLTKYAKDLHVQGLVNDGSNNGQKSKPLIELLETTSKANSQLEQLNEMDSPSESEDELCIVFEKNTASCSKLPSTSTEVTKSKSSKEHDARNSRKRQLSPASQSPSQVPLKKGTKTPAPASTVPNTAVASCSTPDASATKKCSVCKEIFLSNESHREHLVTAHAILLTCSICNKLFTLRASLRKHLKRHLQSFDKLHLMGASVNLTPANGGTDADQT